MSLLLRYDFIEKSYKETSHIIRSTDFLKISPKTERYYNSKVLSLMILKNHFETAPLCCLAAAVKKRCINAEKMGECGD